MSRSNSRARVRRHRLRALSRVGRRYANPSARSVTQVPPHHIRVSLGGRAGGARGAAADQLATNGRVDRRWLSDRQVLPSQRCAVTHVITAAASYVHLVARARMTDLAGPMIPAQSAPFPRADGASVMVGPSRQEGRASITIGMLRTTGSCPLTATERRADGEGSGLGTEPSRAARGPCPVSDPGAPFGDKRCCRRRPVWPPRRARGAGGPGTRPCHRHRWAGQRWGTGSASRTVSGSPLGSPLGWVLGSASGWVWRWAWRCATGLATTTRSYWARRCRNYSVLPWHLFQVTM